jgi:hypothetical protein
MQLRFYVRPAETVSTDSISEAMRITSSGNVGIGTTNPLINLSVNDASLSASYHDEFVLPLMLRMLWLEGILQMVSH